MSVKRSQELSQADQHSPTQISFPSQKLYGGQYWVLYGPFPQKRLKILKEKIVTRVAVDKASLELQEQINHIVHEILGIYW